MSEYRQREKGLSNLVKLLIFGIFLGIFILPVSAAQLGMNYYHESMMNSGGHYITRSAGEASTDLDNINKITPDVKFYMNPYISGNEAWVLQLTSIAKQKGMHVVVVMNVDDRQLSNDSWGDYSNLVVNTAKDFSGKADEFVVGNEISLHGIDRSDVGNLVEPLISSVKSVFNGDVSYEAFWYEKDSLKGYSGKLYFNMYETLDNFKANVNEMNTDFGSNANIGEFGVDMNSVNNNESAQIAQLQQRWDIIQSTQAPVAYIFTYREPSVTGFGLLRPDDSMKPFFGAGSQGQAQASQPAAQPQQSSPSPTVNPTATFNYQMSDSISLKSETINGDSRTVVFSSPSGDIQLMIQKKADNYYEVYRQNAPGNLNFNISVEGSLIDQNTGFTSFNYTQQTAPQPSQPQNVQPIASPVSSGNSGGGSSSASGGNLVNTPKNNTVKNITKTNLVMPAPKPKVNTVSQTGQSYINMIISLPISLASTLTNLNPIGK